MADRYWVGGTGTWGTTTTNWSATSGGPGGASVPTAADNVIFDANSGTNFTVTVGTAARLCLNLTFASGVNGITFAGTATMTVSGSLSLPASGVTWTHTGVITFNSASAITLSTNGVAITSPLTFSGTGSKTLLTALTTTGTVTLSAGTLNLSTYTLTCGAFNASSTTTRSITYGTGSSIVITGTGSSLTMTFLTGFTFTGTSNIRFTYSGAVAMTIAAGTTSLAQSQNLYITAGTYSLTFTGNARTLDFTGFSGTFAQGTNSNTLYGNLVYSATMVTSSTTGVISFTNTSGTQTITTNGITVNNNFNRNGAGGTVQFLDAFIQNSARSFTMTAGTIDLNSYSTVFGIFTIITGTHSFINGSITCTSVTHTSGDLTVSSTNTVTASGTYTFTAGTITLGDGSVLSIGQFSSSNSNARSISYGVGAELRITGTGTVWNTATTTNFSDSGTSYVTFTNATAGSRTITTGTMTSAQAQNFYITAGTGSLTLTTGGFINNLDFTGFSGTYAQAATSVTMFGNIVFSPTMTSTTTTGELRFTPSSSATVTTNGHVLGCTLNAYGDLLAPVKSLVFADSFSQTLPGALRIQEANLDFNNQTYSIGTLAFWPGSGVPLNYGSTLVSAGFQQNGRNLTLGTGGYQVSISGNYELAAGTLTLAASYNLSVASFSTNSSSTRSIVFGAGSLISLSGTGTVWNSATVTGFSYSGTSDVRLTNSGSTATAISSGPMTAAQALNFNITAGTYTFSLANTSAVNNLDFTGFSGTFDQASVSSSVFGNLTFSATMSTAFGSTVTGGTNMAATSGTRTITTNGIQVNLNLYFNGAGGTFQFTDTFIQNSTARFAVSSATVDFNNQTYSIGQLYISGTTYSLLNYGGELTPASVVHNSGTLTIGTGALLSTTGSYEFAAGTITINNGVSLSVGSFLSAYTSTRAIAFGTGNITVTGSGTAWNVTGTTGLSYTGTPTVIINNPTATATTITNTATATNAFDFDFVSGTYSLTLTTGGSWRTLDFTGFTGTLALAATTHTLYGNLILGAGMTTTGTAGSAVLSWISTSGTRTITTNGVVANFEVNINGAGQVVQLADAFITGSGNYGVRLIAGTFDLANYSTSIGRLIIQTGTHAIANGTLTTASVTHSSGDLSIGTGYTVECSGFYTFTAGSITINNGVTLLVGGFTSNNTNTRSIAFGTGNITVFGTGTIWNVTGTTGLSYTGTSNITMIDIVGPSGAKTITNTATAASAFNFNFTNGAYTLTLTTGNSYSNLNFTGFTGTLALGTTTHTMYGNLVLGSGMTTTGTAGTNNLAWISTAGTRTITTNGVVANFGISLNGVGQTLQLADAFVQGSTNTFAYTNGTFDMANYSTSLGVVTITTGTHALLNGTLNCVSVTHTSGNLTIGTGYLLACSGTYTFTAGSITINNDVTLTCGAFSSANSNTRSIAFGVAGNITTTGSGTVWNTGTTTGLSYTGSGNIIVNNAGATATTVTTASPVFFNLNVVGGTYSLTLTNNSVFGTVQFWPSFAGTLALGASAVSVNWHLIYSPNMTSTGTTGAISMIATSGTRTITTNGHTIGHSINFNGVGGTFQLTDTFTQASTASFIITNGTVDFNSQTYTLGILTFVSGTSSYINYGGTLSAASIVHTSGAVTTGTGALLYTAGNYTFTAGTLTINDGVELVVGSFSSPGTSTRVLAFGTGKIVIKGTGSTTAINLSTSSGFSFTGTDNITVDNTTGTDLTFSAVATATSALSVYVISGSYQTSIISGSSFRNLNFTGYTGLLAFSTNTLTVHGDLVLGPGMTTSGTSGTYHLTYAFTSGTRTITTNGVAANFGISMTGVGQTVQLADNFVSDSGFGGLSLTSGTFDINNKTTSINSLVILSGTHAIANGTLNTLSTTHTSGNLTIGTGYTVVTSGTYTFTAGSITINDGASLTVGSFSSANSGTRSIAFGTGSITVTGAGTVWNVTGTTGLSFTGTSSIIVNNPTSTATTVTNTATSTSAFNFNFINGTYTLTLTNGSSFRALDFTGFTGLLSLGTTSSNMYGSLTLGSGMTTSSSGGIHLNWLSTSGTHTITSNGVTINFGIRLNGVGQTVQLADAFNGGGGGLSTVSITSGTLDMNGYSMYSYYVTINTGTHAISNGILSSYSVTHTSGDLSVGAGYGLTCSSTYTFTAGSITINDGVSLNVGTMSTGGTSSKTISFGTGRITVSSDWVFDATNFSYTGTGDVYTSSTGSVFLIHTPGATESNSINMYIPSATGFASMRGGFKTINFTGSSCSFSLSGNISLYKDLILSPSTITVDSGSGYYLSFKATSGIQTLISSGVAIAMNVALEGSAEVQLGDALTATNISHVSGTFSTMNYNITATQYFLGTGVKTVNMGSSLLALSGTIPWYISDTLGLTINPGTSTISLTGNFFAKSFIGGNFTYYNLNQGGDGPMIIEDSNTFNDITATYAPSTIRLGVGTTQTVNNFTLSGTPSNQVSLTTAFPNTPKGTLSKASGEVSVSYLTISNIIATGGASWRAPTSSGNIDSGGNSGWDFSAIIALALGNFFAFF